MKTDRSYQDAYDHYTEYYKDLTRKEVEQFYEDMCALVPMGARQARGFYDATADRLGIERKPIQPAPPIDWSKIPNIKDKVW